MHDARSLRSSWRAAARRAAGALARDLWETDTAAWPRLKRWLLRSVRIVLLVARGFREDQLPVHAASLTYASLMSLVPLLAIVFAVLKGWGVGDEAMQRLLEWTASMPEDFRDFIEPLFSVVQRTRFSTLGWVGFAVLACTALAVLARIETSINKVWGISRQRPFVRRAANYISVLVVVPILVGLAGTVMATLRSEAVMQRIGVLAVVYRLPFRLGPVLVAWPAFSFLYVFLPNTRVRAVPALISGLLGALAWLGWQRLYITLQVGVARYNAIYGTFASIPIFLSWLYISWILVLLGAEITYALQHHDTYALDRHAAHASAWARLRLTIGLLGAAAEAHDVRGEPFQIEDFARRKRLSLRLLSDVADRCVELGWLAEASDRPGTYCWVKRPDRLRQADAARLLLQRGGDPAPEAGDAPWDRDLQKGLETAFGEKTIADLTAPVRAPREPGSALQ